MTGSTALTLLVAEGHRLAKHVHREAQSYRIDGYGKAVWFQHLSIPLIDRPAATHRGLTALRLELGLLEQRTDSCVVMGESLIAGRQGRRRSQGQATLLSVPRQYLPIDLDDLTYASIGLSPDSDVHQLLTAVLRYLPPELSRADCVAQFTGSHGYVGDNIRIRLWFWLSRPLTLDQMKWWMCGYPVDPCIYRPAQPIYTAAPVLGIGVPNLVKHRTLFLRGEHREVTPPAEIGPPARVPTPDPQLQRMGIGTSSSGYAYCRAQVGQNGHFHEELKAATSAYFRAKPDGDANWLVQDLIQAVADQAHTRDPAYIEGRIRDLPGLVRSIQRMEARRWAS